MSRRAERRRSSVRGGGEKKVGKWVLRVFSILVLGVIVSGFGLYAWLKSYLHSDDFRVFMGEVVGEAMGGEARFELFDWQGMRARTAGLSVVNGGVMREMKADGVQAGVSLAGVRRGVWEVSDVRVKRLDVVMDSNFEDVQVGGQNGGGTDGGGSRGEVGFFQRLLPDRAELDSVELSCVNLNMKTGGGELVARGVSARVEVVGGSGGYDIDLAGGVIDTPWFRPRLDLQSASGKYREGRIYLTESRAKVYERGLLMLSGELEDMDFGFYGTLSDVRSEELVVDDWKERIMGDLGAKFTVRSSESGAVFNGELQLNKGVLTELPILDTIAAYANTRRFRRLNLSEARLKFRREGARLDLTDIVLASEGLVRVIGRLSVVEGRLDGRFQVGIMPGTLAHIPGAETIVFKRGEKGLLWSDLRITGTVDNPKEDLSKRMIAAAGQRMFELVPETGKMALKFAHDTAKELPAAAVETGSEVIKEGAEVLREGTDVLRGVLDLIPGASSGDDE